MGETKPYRSEKWHWHSIRDRYKIRSDWNKRNNVSFLSFVKYLCGPRYNFMQVLKIASLVLLSVTCLLNLKLIMETNGKLDNHQLLLDLDEGGDIAPFNEDDYFGHLHAADGGTTKDHIKIKVRSSRDFVEVLVNDEEVHFDDGESGRGIHITVIHESTGEVMSQRKFDTYSMKQDREMIKFLNSISSGRILAFAVKDDASFHLGGTAKEKLRRLGSKLVDQIGWRSTWSMVSTVKGVNYGEKIKQPNDENSWGDLVEVTVEVAVVESPNDVCHWPESSESARRARFCSMFDGYGDLCQCDNPASVVFDTGDALPASSIPLAVIASNRPQYLYRMLRTLLAVRGADPNKIVVFIDGQVEEPYQVAKLFGLKVYQHVPVGVKNARISQHYKSSLGAIFTLFPEADKAIVLEEDLDVSPDFFSYFSETMHLLDEDSSIYCISAWNDQGYDHSCHDPSLLYRVETMPGLGWMLKRSLFENELEPTWPTQDKVWDWDMWMRTHSVRKDRECIIPDVSRTFHFGSTGFNVDAYFFDKYFAKHTIYKRSEVKFKDVEKLKQSSYEQLMHSLIQKSVLLDHTATPCDDEFIPINSKQNTTYVAYFRMQDEVSTEVFLEILKCLKIWDLDARGLHKSSFRTFIKRRHVVFIGYPASPYSLYKPIDTHPIFIKPSNPKNGVDL